MDLHDYDLRCVPAQVAIMASIAVQVEDGNPQRLEFCYLHAVSCLVLVVFRLFANGWDVFATLSNPIVGPGASKI